MPKSRVRKKKGAVYTPPASLTPKKKPPSPRWVGFTVLALLLLGVVWLVVAYMTEGTVWIQEDLGNWNVAVGFGLIASGFALATQWR
jgi:hypothetical protein